MLSTLQMCDSDAQNADCAEFITNDSINAASGMKKGILECVKLWSFMCHEYIEFNLSDHVNFVIGRNGSGKSAILSGIIIGLGGKSQATNRGSSLANFIKKGRPNATVEITLNNIDSYKSQEYGTYIVIRRRFNHDGVSLYNISGEFGLVSNKKDELDQMLDYFNIQVENPTTVLNQDLARNFLASSSTNEKYNFFLKATQLDQIYEMVSFAANEKKKAQAIIQHKEQVLPNLKQEIKVLEEKMSSAVTISQLRDKVRECSVLITWILVKNKEELLGKYEEKKISLNKKFEIIDEKVEKLEKDKASLKSLHENIIFELNELHQQMQNKEIDCQNKQIEIADLKRSVKTMQDQKRQIHCDSQTAKDTLVSMQQKISELEEKVMRANDEMREEKRKNEENLLRELKVKVTEFENLKSIIQTKKSQIWHLDEEMRQINKDVIIMTAELQKLESSKESYKNSIKNRILIYHPKMQHLLGEIEKEFQRGSFTQKPIGPIGNEISLKGECKDLCFAAETALKSVISAFIVNNSSDAQKLDKMATYFGIRLKIIIDKFKDKIYDNINLHKCNLSASGEEISEYAYCIFDMITCSNPQIMNSLIDQLRIESVIIFRDTDKAQKIMSNMPPRNCFKAFTKYGDYIELSPYRFYSNRNKHNTARFLAPNIDHIISEIDNKYKENQKLLNGFKNRTIEVSDLKKKTTNELENLTQELGKFKMQILTIENKLEELKNTQILSSADVDIYKKEYEDQKVLYNEKCAEITVIESQINEKNAIIEKKLSEKLIIDSEISELQANDSQKNLQISKIMSKDKKYDAAIAIYSSKKTPLLPKYKEVEKNIEEINKIIIDYTSKAESVSPRIDTDRSIEDLESEISQTEEIIRIKEQEFGDENQILKTIYLKRTKLRCVEEEINNFKNFLLNLEDSILKRTENQLNLRNSMTTRACLAFDMILKNRGYKGDMIINHDNHTLDISVNIPSSNYENSLKHTNSRIQRALSSPNNISNSRQNQIQSDSFNNLPKMPKLKKTKQVNSQSDIAALSGGERSFATICFIVALWRTMNSPLRCLDEFDVFMDMVNRRYSMDLLLNLAQSEHNSNVQFIFLTPLDMSYLKPSKYISIYKISKEEDKEAH